MARRTWGRGAQPIGERIAELEARLARAEARGADAKVARAHEDLGLLLLDANDPDRAVPHFEWLVARAESRSGPDGDSALNWRGFVGRSLSEARRYAEAEQVLRRLVADRTRVFGPDDDRTLVARGNLARAVGFGGRPLEAIELTEALLADRERLLGPDHPSTLDSRGNLAQFLDAAGDSGSALALLEALLADRIRVLGEDHPVVDSTRHNLLVIASRAGHDDDELVEELEENVEHLRAELGDDHAEALTAQGVLVEHLIATGELRSALQQVVPLIAARTHVLGPTAAPTLTARRLHVRCLSRLEAHDDAVQAAAWLAEDVEAALGCRSSEWLLARTAWLYARQRAGEAGAEFTADVAAAGRLADDLLEPGHPIIEDLAHLVAGPHPGGA